MVLVHFALRSTNNQATSTKTLKQDLQYIEGLFKMKWLQDLSE